METEKEDTDMAVEASAKDETLESDSSEKTVERSEKKRAATDDDDMPVEKKMKVEEQNMEDKNKKASEELKSEKAESLSDKNEEKEIKSEAVNQEIKCETKTASESHSSSGSISTDETFSRFTRVKKEVKSENDDKDSDIDSDDEPLSLKKEKISHAKVDESAGSEHSEDSEKENKNTDLPMDLSTKSSQDIIMLSDESEDEMSKIQRVRRELTLGDMKLKAKMIKRLQAELRNEEAKLVLLKKMRQSQVSAQISENNSANKAQRPSQQHSQPPPLIRGNQPQQQMQARPAHSQPPQLVRGNVPPGANATKGPQGPPPLLPSRVQDQRQLMQNQMQMLQRGGSPANILRGSQAAQAEALRQMQQAQRVVEETPAQRQAAAKLALRKQLEKTLLQIPPPKPPPPEMNFIPSLASPDFIYLLGLEEAVNFIIDSNLISKGAKSPDDKLVCNPFTCVQCGSDYTPVWKREKPGSKNVICEKCVTTNQKKALKQEHTNRLKSAFVKALQQEQEIERMQSQEAKAAAASAPVTTTAAQPQVREGREARDSPSARTTQPSTANYKEVAETLRQHQNLLQAQAASLRMGHPLGLQGLNARFPYQLPFARASDLARATDMQRQYLLDMIPKGGIPWNS